MCISCRARKPKHELIRFSKTKNNYLAPNTEVGSSLGRGSYICKSSECLENLKKSKKFKRFLGEEVIKCVYAKFKKETTVGK